MKLSVQMAGTPKALAMLMDALDAAGTTNLLVAARIPVVPLRNARHVLGEVWADIASGNKAPDSFPTLAEAGVSTEEGARQWFEKNAPGALAVGQQISQAREANGGGYLEVEHVLSITGGLPVQAAVVQESETFVEYALTWRENELPPAVFENRLVAPLMAIAERFKVAFLSDLNGDGAALALVLPATTHHPQLVECFDRRAHALRKMAEWGFYAQNTSDSGVQATV